jgi:hypothetical protein
MLFNLMADYGGNYFFHTRSSTTLLLSIINLQLASKSGVGKFTHPHTHLQRQMEYRLDTICNQEVY